MPGYEVRYTSGAVSQLEWIYWYLVSEPSDSNFESRPGSQAELLRKDSDEIDALLKHGPDSVGDRIPLRPDRLPAHCDEVRQLTLSVLSVRYRVYFKRREVHVAEVQWLPGLTAE